MAEDPDMTDNNNPKVLSTYYEKAEELLRQANNEPDPKIRKLKIQAAKKYFDADLGGVAMNDKNKDIYPLLLFLIAIAGFSYLFFTKLSFLSAIGAIIGTFALLCLMMGVILRIRGDLSETNLLEMVREGFKALLLLRKSKQNNNPPNNNH
jgi:vacuolar-type H+-ATPase subunit E/Vma4